jgi:hypothetical protein
MFNVSAARLVMALLDELMISIAPLLEDPAVADQSVMLATALATAVDVMAGERFAYISAEITSCTPSGLEVRKVGCVDSGEEENGVIDNA